MLSLLRRPRGRDDSEENPVYSKNIARERLQNAISRDRRDLVMADGMEALSQDLLTAVSRHLEIVDGCHELEIRRLDQALYLVASVKIRNKPRWEAAE